jgi:hypothetical protein
VKQAYIGKAFSDGAKRDMENMGIQRVSEKVTPRFNPEKIFLRIFKYIDRLLRRRRLCMPSKKSKR